MIRAIIGGALSSAMLLCSAQASNVSDTAVGDRVTVPGFRYAPGKAFAGDVTLRRIDVYAPGAKIYVVADDGPRELPRSTLQLFVTDPAHTATRLYVAVDPARQSFTGAVFEAGDVHAIDGVVEADRLRVTATKAIGDALGAFTCGGSPGEATPAHPLAELKAMPVPAAGAGAKGASRTVIVAVDTDNELMQLKFSDNTTTATNYLAQLFTGMTLIYERDLDVRLMQGTTFLRVSTTTDPYPSTTATSTSAQLTEFGAHWRNNPLYTTQPGGAPVVPRTFAMQLSGKSGSANSASGIAWLVSNGNYCTATGSGGSSFGHYSITRIFRGPGTPASADVSIVAHELGHNFGASHTHCSSATTGAGGAATNTIDQCYATETNCYAGPTSCPVSGPGAPRGSLMSYCHFSNANGSGGNCGSTFQEFHPAHETLLLARVQTNVMNGCIAGDAPSVANLSVTKTSATEMTAPGAAVAYTITVANGGPDAATGVQLVDPTPAGLTFVSASGGGCTAFPCALGTMNAGAQTVVTANYTVNGNVAVGTIINNVATVASTTTDVAMTNNADGHAITVAPAGMRFRSGFENGE